ncbi:phytanoyl-CoA dioxygenase family protein [Paenibacillus cremeus]|nr:phytanoyl-CoA dioxygenase family protein [Paenibacillus cremeus]
MTNQVVSEEKICFYRENGFVKFDSMLSQKELAELREALDEVMSVDSERSFSRVKDSAYYKMLNQKVNTWRDSAAMGKFVLHPRLAQIALELSGASGIRLFHDHALWKMPGDSKPTPWHQDAPYWPMKETGPLSIWITLDDVDEQNGCMMFVPKSHNVGKLKGISLTEPESLFDYLSDDGNEPSKAVVVPMKAGSCTFHHGLTFHYAFANQTDKPRRVLAIIYMPDGTTFLERKHVVTDEISFREGEPLGGRLFPLLAIRDDA